MTCIEPFGWSTGDQNDFFILAAFGLTQESRPLRCEGEADIL